MSLLRRSPAFQHKGVWPWSIAKLNSFQLQVSSAKSEMNVHMNSKNMQIICIVRRIANPIITYNYLLKLNYNSLVFCKLCSLDSHKTDKSIREQHMVQIGADDCQKGSWYEYRKQHRIRFFLSVKPPEENQVDWGAGGPSDLMPLVYHSISLVLWILWTFNDFYHLLST
jgi:hypothetical protein